MDSEFPGTSSPTSPGHCSEKPKCFKDRKQFNFRKKDSDTIVDQYPDKLPIIIERYKNEKGLPVLDKIKYLVPYEMTMGTLSSIIRKRLQLNATQSLFLIVNNKNVFCSSTPLGEIFAAEKDDDGFLYVVYASQEVFGQ